MGAYVVCYLLFGAVLAITWVTRSASWPLGTQGLANRESVALPRSETQSDAAVRVVEVESKVDPNTANWAELASLPGIGEVLAKRIVEHRQGKAAAPNEPTFRRPEDLEAVRGIGPKTVAKLAKHLKFPEAATAPGS